MTVLALAEAENRVRLAQDTLSAANIRQDRQSISLHARTCSFDGCTERYYAKGFCSAHYQQMRSGKQLVERRARHRGDTIRDVVRSHTIQVGACLVWTGYRNHAGYGRVSLHGRLWLVHRAVWVDVNGETPNGMQVDHRCHVRACVAINHLQLATVKENAENRAGARTGTASGIRGVTWSAHTGMWRGRVYSKGVEYAAGYFSDIGDAERAVIALRNELFTNNLIDRRFGEQADE